MLLDFVRHGLAPERSRSSLIRKFQRRAHRVRVLGGPGRECVLLLADPVHAVQRATDAKRFALVQDVVVWIAVRANELAEQARLVGLAKRGMDNSVQGSVWRISA